MIHMQTKQVINDSSLIFEFKIDNIPPKEIIIDELNYSHIKENSRNVFDSKKMYIDELKPLMECFKDEFLYDVVSKIYESNETIMQRLWPFNKNRYGVFGNFLKEYTCIVTSIFLDTPGFKLSKHIDNRFTVANFILNLIDNPVSTKFYDYRNDSKLIYEAPKEKGTGIFFLNYENNYHSYNNDTNENRYAMISSIILNLP